MSTYLMNIDIDNEIISYISDNLIKNYGYKKIDIEILERENKRLFNYLRAIEDILPEGVELGKYIKAFVNNIDNYSEGVNGWHYFDFKIDSEYDEVYHKDVFEENLSIMINFCGYSWALLYIILHVVKHKKITTESLKIESKDIQQFEKTVEILLKNHTSFGRHTNIQLSEYMKLKEGYYETNLFGKVNFYDLRGWLYGRYIYYKQWITNELNEKNGKFSQPMQLLKDYYLNKSNNGENIYTDDYKKRFIQKYNTNRDNLDDMYAKFIKPGTERVKGTKQQMTSLENIKASLFGYPDAQKLVDLDLDKVFNNYQLRK